MVSVSDNEVIEASKNSRSARQAAILLNMPFSSYKRRAEKPGVYKTNQGLSGLTISEKTYGKKSDCRFNAVNDNAFQTEIPEKYYWLGFIAADGSVVGDNLSFVLSKQDMETLERLKKFLDTTYEIHYHKSHYTDEDGIVHYFDAVNFKVKSKQIVSDLALYGIKQNKTYKNIDYLKFIPDKYKLDFIIGLFDGDGSVSIGNNTSINIAVSKKCTESICEALKGSHIDTSINNRDAIDVIYVRDKNSRHIFKDLCIKKYKEYGTMERKYQIMKRI